MCSRDVLYAIRVIVSGVGVLLQRPATYKDQRVLKRRSVIYRAHQDELNERGEKKKNDVPSCSGVNHVHFTATNKLMQGHFFLLPIVQTFKAYLQGTC